MNWTLACTLWAPGQWQFLNLSKTFEKYCIIGITTGPFTAQWWQVVATGCKTEILLPYHLPHMALTYCHCDSSSPTPRLVPSTSRTLTFLLFCVLSFLLVSFFVCCLKILVFNPCCSSSIAPLSHTFTHHGRSIEPLEDVPTSFWWFHNCLLKDIAGISHIPPQYKLGPIYIWRIRLSMRIKTYHEAFWLMSKSCWQARDNAYEKLKTKLLEKGIKHIHKHSKNTLAEEVQLEPCHQNIALQIT